MTEQNIPVRPIPINQIRPDPTQPRKLLPPKLAQMLSSGVSPLDILDQLRTRAARDKWTRKKLSKLGALANSIGKDGLMNPIRIIRNDDDHYRIEQGERRWWAHHILVRQGNERFQTIAAFVVDPNVESSGLLRRRVAENVHRDDFTAIELAHAMANRILEILAAKPDTKQSEAERLVGKENGMSDRRVRQFLALLNLSPECQELAQQARLSENALRRIVGIEDPALQLAAVRKLIHPANKKRATWRSVKARKHSPQHPRLHGRIHSNAAGVRISPKPGSRVKRSVRLSNGKNIRQGHVEKTLRSLRTILSVASSFRPSDWKRLASMSWAQVVKGHADRRVLAKLCDVLERGLKLPNAQDAGEKNR